MDTTNPSSNNRSVTKSNQHMNSTDLLVKHYKQQIDRMNPPNSNNTLEFPFVYPDRTSVLGISQTELHNTTTDDNSLLVDCGATAHCLNDRSQFISFDETFNPEEHYVKLANGETSNELAKKRGTALLNICDLSGAMRRTRLEDALFIPSFPQNILSVHAAARKGARIELGLNGGCLITKNGTVFSIETRHNLYYLNIQ